MVRWYNRLFRGLLVCAMGLPVSYVKTKSVHTEDLRLESPFPSSPYREVYRSCIKLWLSVRDARGQEMGEEALHQFNTTTISSLIDVYNRVGGMLEHQRSCSHEDLEHLMGVLCIMHSEYLVLQSRWLRHEHVGREIVCGAVLFDIIERMLEKRLV